MPANATSPLQGTTGHRAHPQPRLPNKPSPAFIDPPSSTKHAYREGGRCELRFRAGRPSPPHTDDFSSRPERSASRPAGTPSPARLPLAESIRADNHAPINLGGTSSAHDLGCACSPLTIVRLARPAPNKCTPSHIQCCTSSALASDPPPRILMTPACTSCTTQRRHAVGA
jgi:hypothetical protein